jgi:hypothetical protein
MGKFSEAKTDLQEFIKLRPDDKEANKLVRFAPTHALSKAYLIHTLYLFIFRMIWLPKLMAS